MTINASNFYNTGSMLNIPNIYANNITTPGLSNLTIDSSVDINGAMRSLYSKHNSTIYATFRLTSNLPFTAHERTADDKFVLDFTTTDMTFMNSMPMEIAPNNIFNYTTGLLTVPVSGLYYIHMQGSFSNSVEGAKNGVYYYLKNWNHSNARVIPAISSESVVSTNHIAYLLAGDKLQPTFYSSDSNAVLLSGAGETNVGFCVLGVTAVSHSNYVRV